MSRMKKIFAVAFACFSIFLVNPESCCSALINFDDIPDGVIGNQYLSRGVKFFCGNGTQGGSTGILMSGGQPVTAYAGSFGTAISSPRVMVSRPGNSDDIIVHFFDGSGQRAFTSSVGVFNDTQGDPSRIFIEGFDIAGQSLGRTQIDGGGVGGTFSASGIYTAKIYGSPGFGGLLGVDNFSFTAAPAAVPEPATLVLYATGFLGMIGQRRLRPRVR